MKGKKTQNSTQDMLRMMNQTGKIRNIAIISHSDHGKTSLCDSFLAYAGIINPDLVGKKRFTDKGRIEIERGITIDTSFVSFIYTKGGKNDD